jgi:hypothetical protein
MGWRSASAGGELLLQTRDPRARQSIVNICPGMTWTQIHVINCHNFSLVAAVCSQEHQYVGRGAVRAKVEDSNKFDGDKCHRKSWLKCDKSFMDQLSQFMWSYCSNGLNCHIVTVGPRFWETNVCFGDEWTVLQLLGLNLDYLSLGLNEQQSNCH